VEFHKNLGRIGDIYVAYSKVDPSVSHIWKAVDAGALQVSARLLASPVPRHVAGTLWLLSTEKNAARRL
jgi:hypothetical protein